MPLKVGYARASPGVPVTPFILPTCTMIGSAAAILVVAFDPRIGLTPRAFMGGVVILPFVLALRAGFRSELRGWRYTLWAMLVIASTVSAVMSSFILAVVRV
jgi:hypothetical protein